MPPAGTSVRQDRVLILVLRVREDSAAVVPVLSPGLAFSAELAFHWPYFLDQASEEKKRLEEKQRAARKNRSKSEEDWKTRYVPYSVA